MQLFSRLKRNKTNKSAKETHFFYTGNGKH